MWLIRWWFLAVRSRWREIRNCPSCYKIGFDSPGPPGPDDVITADDRWHSPASGAPLSDLRAAKEAFKRATLEDDPDDPLDLNREDIN